MSEMNKGPKYIVLIVVTMLLVISGYQYIIDVTIMGVRILSQSSSQIPERPSSNLSSDSSSNNASQTPCPAVPEGLEGRLVVADLVLRMPELVSRNPAVTRGGEWRPQSCQPRHSVALVVPFRNRAGQLLVFLNHIHNFLQRQNLHYRIYVITQADNQRFNRGKLINVGFVEALKDFAWDCFIFHDVDLLPEDDRNLYSCPVSNPRHMSVAVSKWQYKLPYPNIFGGVVAINTKQFRILNGFSNEFWGWGGEDDDMAARIKLLNLRVERYSSKIARYVMIRHNQEEVNKDRLRILNTSRNRMKVDGIKNLKYSLLSRIREQLFTNISALLLPNSSQTKVSTKTLQTPKPTTTPVKTIKVNSPLAMREAIAKLPIFWKLKLRG